MWCAMKKKEEKCLSVCELWLVHTKDEKAETVDGTPRQDLPDAYWNYVTHSEYLAFISRVCARVYGFF